MVNPIKIKRIKGKNRRKIITENFNGLTVKPPKNEISYRRALDANKDLLFYKT